ncbi:interleukin 17a/f1 precursor [Danio rerio]|uniref:Interleukin 17_1 n=1 Tax=Danio rerio TaxID=7955 RepID=Q5TKT4_DANRE|nr:interleukin 17a/f1 precursor [Danio rerio]BAD72786.1 Interleukin 17_1 [Danio rerio]|eukprot:NP_001018623.1 interleukin 17a/f1 precursor [Danio rerio]
MSSALNLRFLMVACMMGLVLISFGAEGASVRSDQKNKNSHPEADHSYRLVLDAEFKASTNPIHPINNDSISPWTYMFTHNESLYPTSIAEAKCSLTGCLIDGVEVQDYESKPIYTQIMVLRRIRGEKPNYSFKLEYKTIAVGCTCVRPYVEQL